MPIGKINHVPLTGEYNPGKPAIGARAAKPPSGKMLSSHVQVTAQEVNRKNAAPGATFSVTEETSPSVANSRFFYTVPEDVSGTLDFTDIPPGEKLTLRMGKFTPLKELSIKVWDGVKINVTRHNARTPVHVNTVSGDHYKANGSFYYGSSASMPFSAKQKSIVHKNGEYHFPDVPKCETGSLRAMIPLRRGWSAKQNIGAQSNIVCRHIATMVLLNRLHDKATWKEQLTWTMATPENSATIFSKKDAWERLATDVLLCGPTSHHLFPESFGKVLAYQVGTMAQELTENGQRAEKHFYTVLSEYPSPLAHAVAISLIAKKENDGITYKVKLYDPNETIVHTGFNTTELGDLMDKSLVNWNPAYNCYTVVEMHEIPKGWPDQFCIDRPEYTHTQWRYEIRDGFLTAQPAVYSEEAQMARYHGKKVGETEV